MHFAEFLRHGSLNALVYSTIPPVLVWGTAYIVGAFPGSWYQSLRAEALIITPYIVNYAIRLHWHIQQPADLTFSVLPTWYRNINLFSIDYAFRPRLRYRLTLPGTALDRNPWDFGGRDSHPSNRYSCQHSHF